MTTLRHAVLLALLGSACTPRGDTQEPEPMAEANLVSSVQVDHVDPPAPTMQSCADRTKPCHDATGPVCAEDSSGDVVEQESACEACEGQDVVGYWPMSCEARAELLRP